MTLDWKALGTQVGLTGAIFYGVLKLFKEIEDKLNADRKLAISVWLLDAETKSVPAGDWAATCYGIFIQVFGTRHFSWRCLVQSAKVSFIAFWSTFVVWLVVMIAHGGAHDEALKLIVFATVINFPLALIPDFFSLYITRLTLRQATKVSGSAFDLTGLLITDLYLSAVIFTMAYKMGFIFLFALAGSGVNVLLHNLLQNLPTLFDRTAVLDLLKSFVPSELMRYVSPRNWLGSGPYLVSALCTSGWLWAYVIAGLFLRTARRASTGLRWANQTLDIEAKPLQAIGTIVATGLSLIWLIGVLWFDIVQHYWGVSS